MLSWLFKPLLCLLLAGFLAYCWLDRSNQLLQIRLELPLLMQEVAALQQEQVRLQYTLDELDQPLRLHKLLKEPAFQHLTYPYLPEVVFVREKRPGSV